MGGARRQLRVGSQLHGRPRVLGVAGAHLYRCAHRRQGFGFAPVARVAASATAGPRPRRRRCRGRCEYAIDRGAMDDTGHRRGCAIDNLVQIGHNVRMGRSSIVCGQAGISGSVEIGNGVVIGGAGRVADHVKVGDGAQLGGGGGAIQDIEPGAILAGLPAIPIRDWHRQSIGLARMSIVRRRKTKRISARLP